MPLERTDDIVAALKNMGIKIEPYSNLTPLKDVKDYLKKVGLTKEDQIKGFKMVRKALMNNISNMEIECPEGRDIFISGLDKCRDEISARIAHQILTVPEADSRTEFWLSMITIVITHSRAH